MILASASHFPLSVSPAIPVDAILEYSQGNDPQLEAAVGKMIEILESNYLYLPK
jgi:hypothetical protein